MSGVSVQRDGVTFIWPCSSDIELYNPVCPAYHEPEGKPSLYLLGTLVEGVSRRHHGMMFDLAVVT